MLTIPLSLSYPHPARGASRGRPRFHHSEGASFEVELKLTYVAPDGTEQRLSGTGPDLDELHSL